MVFDVADGKTYDEALRRFKRLYVDQVLRRHGGNQCAAAEELGVHRNTMSRMLGELDLAQRARRMRREPEARAMLYRRIVAGWERAQESRAQCE